jgi:hypothetical protein
MTHSISAAAKIYAPPSRCVFVNSTSVSPVRHIIYRNTHPPERAYAIKIHTSHYMLLICQHHIPGVIFRLT